MNQQLIDTVKTKFIKTFDTNPLMVFSPGRINLIGEHTDYNKGFVFPAAIDKGIVTAISKSNSDKSTIVALNTNDKFEFSIKDIVPLNNGSWQNYILGVVSEIQRTGKQIQGFNLIFNGDIPIGAGLSSSAALENSVVYALNKLFNLEITKNEMIVISQKAEHNFVGVKCGIMDQYASMFGKKDTAILLDCNTLEATSVSLKLQEYSILLINTNVKHSLAESAYNERRKSCEKVASKLGFKSLREVSIKNLQSIKDSLSESDYQKALYVIQENNRVLRAFEAIKQNNITRLGELLFASHKGLQNQYEVSCEELDFLVDFSKNSNAVIGARMMGGGFGGCTINLLQTRNLEDFKKEIIKTYYNRFKNNCSFYSVKLSDGTKVI